MHQKQPPPKVAVSSAIDMLVEGAAVLGVARVESAVARVESAIRGESVVACIELVVAPVESAEPCAGRHATTESIAVLIATVNRRALVRTVSS